MDSAFAVQTIERRAHIAAGQLFDCLLQVRVALPQNLAELHRHHAGFLKLCERTACLDRFVLPRVSYQKDTIIPMQVFDKLVHLPRGGERRFVDHI